MNKIRDIVTDTLDFCELESIPVENRFEWICDNILSQLFAPSNSDGDVIYLDGSSEVDEFGQYVLPFSVAFYDDEIVINSNNLRELRMYVLSMFEDGIMMIRDKKAERKYKDQKQHKYFRVYRSSMTQPICYN